MGFLPRSSALLRSLPGRSGKAVPRSVACLCCGRQCRLAAAARSYVHRRAHPYAAAVARLVTGFVADLPARWRGRCAALVVEGFAVRNAEAPFAERPAGLPLPLKRPRIGRAFAACVALCLPWPFLAVPCAQRAACAWLELPLVARSAGSRYRHYAGMPADAAARRALSRLAVPGASRLTAEMRPRCRVFPWRLPERSAAFRGAGDRPPVTGVSQRWKIVAGTGVDDSGSRTSSSCS